MLAQPRKIRLVARQAKATEREGAAMRLQACDRPVRHWGNPPEPVARSAEPRLGCGAWFGLGFIGFPVGNTTGDFLLALGLVATSQGLSGLLRQAERAVNRASVVAC